MIISNTVFAHQLNGKTILGENQIPVMPMLHILSTHGFLLSFNFLNFQPTRVDICSPPQNLADQSGLHLFRPITVECKPSSAVPPTMQSNAPLQQQLLPNAPRAQSASDFQANITFDISGSGATSTPAKPPTMQAKPTGFGLQQTTDSKQPKPAVSSLFGGTSATGFGSLGFNLGGTKEVAKPQISQQASVLAPAPTSAAVIPQNNINTTKVATEASKPFITVPSTYKPASQPTK